MFGKNSIIQHSFTTDHTLADFTCNKSDIDVENFINEYIIKK